MTTSRFPTPRLRDVRKARHLSLDELALRSGSERSKLSRAERGYAKFNSDELKRLADVLRVPVKALTAPVATEDD